MPTFAPSQWGSARDTSMYQLFMEGENCVAEPYELCGHDLSSFSQELTDPVRVPICTIVNGRKRIVNKILAPGIVTEVSATLQFPSSLWTPALHQARQGLACNFNFFAKFLCPPNENEAHAYVFQDSQLDPPTFAGDLIITSAETPTVINEQTTMRAPAIELIWGVKGELLTTLAGATTSVVDFNTVDCGTCETEPWLRMLAGSDDADFTTTNDRFTTSTVLGALDFPVPASSVLTDLFANGNTVLVSYRNAAGATGGVAVSSDGGQTFTLATGLGGYAYYGLTRLGSDYIAVGGATGAPARIYRSRNGIAWTAVAASATLFATSNLRSVSADNVAGAFYAVGEDGSAVKGTPSGSGYTLTDITAAVAAGAVDLSSVEVLGEDFVAVGGPSGFYVESFDGGEDFEAAAAFGGASAVFVDGNCLRTVAGTGTRIFERSILTNYEWKEVPLIGVTLTGDIVDVEMADPDYNYFLVSTDAGEVVLVKPQFPNA